MPDYAAPASARRPAPALRDRASARPSDRGSGRAGAAVRRVRRGPRPAGRRPRRRLHRARRRQHPGGPGAHPGARGRAGALRRRRLPQPHRRRPRRGVVHVAVRGGGVPPVFRGGRGTPGPAHGGRRPADHRAGRRDRRGAAAHAAPGGLPLPHARRRAGRDVYVVQHVIDLRGPLDAAALRRAAQALLDRHAPLRAGFRGWTTAGSCRPSRTGPSPCRGARSISAASARPNARSAPRGSRRRRRPGLRPGPAAAAALHARTARRRAPRR